MGIYIKHGDGVFTPFFEMKMKMKKDEKETELGRLLIVDGY